MWRGMWLARAMRWVWCRAKASRLSIDGGMPVGVVVLLGRCLGPHLFLSTIEAKTSICLGRHGGDACHHDPLGGASPMSGGVPRA